MQKTKKTKTTIKTTPIWNDVRPSIADYTPAELLGYYRVSKWLVNAHTGHNVDDSCTKLASNICDMVDNVFEAMRCMPDYRVVSMTDIVRREYCEEPATAAEKIDRSNVCRTTYYTYLRQGEELFYEMCNSMIHTFGEMSASSKEDDES